MDLIPVIDLMQGHVIRGQAGQRESYQPNTSKLLASIDPRSTCQSLIRHYRPRCIYVADIDGIQDGQPQYSILESLVACGTDLVVDAGTDSLAQAQRVLELGVTKVIIGLETLPSLDLMKELISELGADRVIFSLDLFNGIPLGPDAAGKTPLEIVATAMECGVRQMIVLDLSHVGMNRGVPTGALCHTIKNRWPDLVVWTGGGVRSLADLHKLSLLRVDGAMVASALHDGHITPADWKSFETLSNDRTQMAMDA
ncbi:HisA/HisF-related TIM barrel protein [Planctomicrobium sp. SH661]|uniref:HisA/HisF-related TIM barrel protein n=1 Tax=Planctomicrobium sp. SH661 TaxID=3448124 RepID=UPI003F5C67BD